MILFVISIVCTLLLMHYVCEINDNNNNNNLVTAPEVIE